MEKICIRMFAALMLCAAVMSTHAKDAASAFAAETALVRARWSGFVTTDKVERVMANAYVTAKPLGDAQAIPLHDAGKTIVYDWESGDADDLLAAVGVGAEYVRTSRPL